MSTESINFTHFLPLTADEFSAGDAGDAALALMVIKTCDQIEGGLPSRLRMMMMMNLIIDFIIGLVPFVGDVVDAIYKCNTRNAVLLEKHLREKGGGGLSNKKRQHDTGGVQDTSGVDMSLPDEFDKADYGVVDNSSGIEMPTKPERATQPQRSHNKERRFGGSIQREEDLERGGA